MSDYTPFKMKGFSGFKNSPAKQKVDPTAKPWGDEYKKTQYKKWGKKGFPGDMKANTKMSIDWHHENKLAQSQKLAKVKKPSILNRMIKAFSNPSIKSAGKILKTVKTLAKNPLTPTGIALGVGEAIVPKVVKATQESLKKDAKTRSKGKATDLFKGPKY